MHRHVYRITAVEVTGPSSLRVVFDDGICRDVELRPVLRGALYGPLAEPAEFARVIIDAECGVLVWPCGADFDPATLHDWPTVGPAFAAAAAGW